MTWKQDRDWLRSEIKKGVRGIKATMLYALLSHMRGKLHMRSYAQWGGGWNRKADPSGIQAPAYLEKAYGTEYQKWFDRCVILDLNQQAAWIRKYTRQPGVTLQEIAERVLDKAWESSDRISAAV
jgi:hypothetical protein